MRTWPSMGKTSSVKAGPSGPLLAVRAIVVDARGRVLLLRRSRGGAGAALWCLPGGKVDYGETVQAALVRELKEETSLDCREACFLFYQDSPSDRPGGTHFVNLYFKCAVTGALALNLESSQATWASTRALSRLPIAFGNKEGIRRFLAAERTPSPRSPWR
jgi:8-oxo-dGTP diphosphatase